MIYVTDNAITLTKGDSLALPVAINKKYEDGHVEPYEVQSGEKLRFAVSTGFYGEVGYKLHISKQIDPNAMLIILEPSDTKSMKNKTYNYDVEITHLNGMVDTFIASTFTLVGDAE